MWGRPWGRAVLPEVQDPPGLCLGLHMPLMSWHPLCHELKGESLRI